MNYSINFGIFLSIMLQN